MTELTQKGTVAWVRVDPPNMSGTGDFSDIAFFAKYDGENLRIFRKRFKHAFDEDRFEWSERPVLQVTDNVGTALYEFPHSSAIYDLIDTVEYQVSGVGVLIDKLASES